MNVSFGRGKSNLTDQIVDGIGIRQGFIAQADILISVFVAFATYCRKNSGELYLEIRDSESDKIAEIKVNIGDLGDNSNHEFVFNVNLIKGRMYELRIRTINCRSGNSVTGKYCRKSQDGHMFIGARLIKNGELSCVFKYGGDTRGGGFLREEIPEKMVKIDGDYLPGLVSIVIPHFNCPSMLAKCMAALTRQTYSGISVMVVDDGSENPAYPESVVRSYSSLLPVSFMKLGKNCGAPTARNEGANLAVGEYLLLLDADCFLYPDAIEVFVTTLMENEKADYAYGGFRWGNEEIKPKKFDLATLKLRNYITMMSMIRRGKFPGMDTKLKRHQDWDLWLTMSKSGGYGVCTGRMMFETPNRGGGISADSNISMAESIAIVRRKHGL